MRNELTVVIPVYNVEKYLSKCIESILNQTLPVDEIILVDDGSKIEAAKSPMNMLQSIITLR